MARVDPRHEGGRGKRTIALAVLAVDLVAALAITTSEAWLLPAMAIAAVGLVLWLLRSRLNPFFLSPVQLVIGAYLVLAGAGLLFYDKVAEAPAGAGIRVVISQTEIARTFWLMMTGIVATLVGAGAVALLGRAETPATHLKAVHVGPGARERLLYLTMVPAIAMIAGAGPGYYLHRATYLPSGGASVTSVAVPLAVAAVLILGFIVSDGSPPQRRIAVALLILYTALLLALGTRQFALVPVLVAAGMYAGSITRRARIGLAVAAVVSFLLLPIPLFLRGLDSHGLVPYLAAMPQLLHQTTNYDNLGLNLLIGHGTTAVVAFDLDKIPTRDFWTSVNPAPGRMTNWYQVAPSHRLNDVTPYPTFGELGNYGMLYLVGYFMVAGMFLGYLERRVRHWLSIGSTFVGLALLGLAGLFVLFSAQYSTRTSSRILLYCVLLDGANRGVRILRRSIEGSEAWAARELSAAAARPA